MANTIKDIANRLGLSKSTVSYALNGHSKHVSEELRTRILEVAKEMGYRPNEVARSLAIGRTHTIGFVPMGLERFALDSAYVQIALQSVYVTAEDHGLHILLPTGYNPSHPEFTPDRLFQARVDGMVLITGEDSPMLRDFVSRDIPLAIVAGTSGTVGPTFNVDNIGGGRMAADYLVELGHRRVALLGSHLYGDVRERGDAFRDRLIEHGLEVPESYVRLGNSRGLQSYDKALELLKAEPRPTAIFAVNDQMAYAVIHAAQSLGLKVPEDVSVMGFDDDLAEATEISTLFMPQLTTLRQPVAQMAKAAFEAVVSQFEGSRVQSKVFSTQLVVRGTTAPFPRP